ncbi:MAG: hypothetical protein H0V79_02430 [Actinobacteria bacterium]|nr:hypothetical protein [Actinomycetota bacterium]
MSIRALARAVGVTDAHLSRVLRRAAYKSASPDLARRVALTLGLPNGYFVEDRLGFVIDHIREHPRVRDELYDRLKRTRR